MTVNIHFTKMHGLGNDFVVLDNITQSLKIEPRLIRRISDRNFGIGCDQILIVEPPTQPDLDFNYRIFNADGKEVSQCGNGARCIGRYIYDNGFSDKKVLKIGTLAGEITIVLSDLTSIQVDMGKPNFHPDSIPLKLNALTVLPLEGRYRIKIFNEERDVTILSLGNPHCVFLVFNTEEADVKAIGEALQKHPAFLKGVNVSFVQVLARNHIKCRVFERGVGETLACGTAACASVITGVLQEQLNPEVKVDMPGGALTVRWEAQGSAFLSGPTMNVFHGEFTVTSAPIA